jgi:hypothetical protein
MRTDAAHCQNTIFAPCSLPTFALFLSPKPCTRGFNSIAYYVLPSFPIDSPGAIQILPPGLSHSDLHPNNSCVMKMATLSLPFLAQTPTHLA